MAEVAQRWSQFFWASYSMEYSRLLTRARELQSQKTRNDDESQELWYLVQMFSGGFCIGGHLQNGKTPAAYEVAYAPTLAQPPNPTAVAIGSTRFWGCPNLVNRLIYGLDLEVLSAILQSGKWNGTDQELFELISPHCLGQPQDLPIREAIDWVHASIYTTIKTMKFSHLAPVCGGPVEVAVITTDRNFRWVRHKRFDAAIEDGR